MIGSTGRADVLPAAGQAPSFEVQGGNMRRFGYLAGAVSALLFAVACQKGSDDGEVFQARLQGENEVPPRVTSASGGCGFTLEGGTVHYSIEVHGLTTITGAHVHSGATGVNGPIRVGFFFSSAATPTMSVNDGVILEGSFAASNVNGVTFDELLNQMRAGTAYCNVHSPTYPGGEIRGQVRGIN